MIKKIVFFFIVLISNSLFAANAVDLYRAPLSSLSHYKLMQKLKNIVRMKVNSASENISLQQVNLTQGQNKTIIRYQELYKGIPIVGAQVMITKGANQGFNDQGNGEVNGHLLDAVQLNTKPDLSSQKALELAKQSYFSINAKAATQEEVSELQIRPGENNELKLVYLVSFKSARADNKPVWPFFVIDAQTGVIRKQWNNIKNYLDSGPGGNEKIHEYWYGKDGLPSLSVIRRGTLCVMDSPSVKLVNLRSSWDWSDTMLTAFVYRCNNNREENTNGGFSPSNDAYYFGHTVVKMYKNWYGVNALQNEDGTPMKLIMRVHFGLNFDNAFWDGQAMSFGDGQDLYPLVSLDVAGHEVTHGFTQQHSNLEYYDQSGALNESFSDMAGQASRAYLLETNYQLYSRAYLQSDEVTWGLGETVVREAFGKAIRFMDFPSSDGSSADCLDRNLAQSNGAYCAISYNELSVFAKLYIADLDEQQGYIVHTASGVFNKAFYLLSKNIGIKRAYHVMVIANVKYWTPSTGFKEGACGALYAAKDLKEDIDMVKSVFGQVGIDTGGCEI